MFALSGRYLCWRTSSLMHILSARFLPESRSSRSLHGMSIGHLYTRRRLKISERMHTRMRLRHILAHWTRSMSRMSTQFVFQRTTNRWLQRLSSLSAEHLHLSTGRTGQRSLSRKMCSWILFVNWTRTMFAMPAAFLSKYGWPNDVHRMPDEYENRWSGCRWT